MAENCTCQKKIKKRQLKHELESSVSGVNSLQKEQCAFTTSGVKGAKKRKYYRSYMTFRFTYTGNEEYPDGLFLLYNKTFSITSLVPAKLKRNLETSHPSYQNKEIAFFGKKLQSFESFRCLLAKCLKANRKKQQLHRTKLVIA